MSRAFIFRASLASASKTSCSLPTTGRSYSPDRRLQSNNRSDDKQTHGENLCTANPIILRLIGRVFSRDANHLRLHVTLGAQHRVFPANAGLFGAAERDPRIWKSAVLIHPDGSCLQTFGDFRSFR